MKIAFLVLSGGVINRGAEHAIHLLAEDLVVLGHTVHVYQTGFAIPGSTYQTITIPIGKRPDSHKPHSLFGKVLDRLYLNQRGRLILQFSRSVMTHLKGNEYDIIVPTDGFWQVLLTKATVKKTKIVTIGLAGMGWTDANTLSLSPDAFVALSPSAAAWAQAKNPHIHVTTIPLQVDTQLFNHLAIPAKLSIKHPVVITVAALTAYKRIDAVIRSVAEIPGLSLLVLGQGEEEHSLQKLADTLLPGRFELTSCSYQELPRYYASADAFTLASESQEAFGRVLIEAQACGLPIVTTNDPIRRWIVGEKGWFINPLNLPSYTQALQAAVKQGRRRRLDPNTHRFSRTKIAKEYETLFASLLQ